MTRPTPLVVAHRGSSSAVAEHTLGAYRLALSEGADALECDVRLTADRVPVCLHDRTLERTGASDGVVSTMTLDALSAVDWGAWKHAGAPGDPTRDPEWGRLTTLRDLLELAVTADRGVGLAIETKHPTRFGGRVEHEVAALLSEFDLAGPQRDGMAWARMMSFSQLAVRRMQRICPELPTVFLMSHPLPLAYRGGALPAGAGAAGLDLAILRARPEVVARQHDEGHEVFVWTVDEDVDIQRCLELKVDAIITNRPRHVLDVVARNR